MVVKFFLGIGFLALILLAVTFFSIKSVQSTPPPQIIVNFANLDKIQKISKYRSCQGHVVVPQNEKETRRNMKHYFWVKPEYTWENAVEIYSPFNGYVTAMYANPLQDLEGEIWISPVKMLANMPPFEVWSFSVQHINIRKDLRAGSQVKAGELIGYAAVSERSGDSFDIVYGKLGPFIRKIDNWTAPYSELDSVFNHMSDEAFTQYQGKGIYTKEELIISKVERDQNPCRYEENGPQFAPGSTGNDWLWL